MRRWPSLIGLLRVNTPLRRIWLNIERGEWKRVGRKIELNLIEINLIYRGFSGRQSTLSFSECFNVTNTAGRRPFFGVQILLTPRIHHFGHEPATTSGRAAAAVYTGDLSGLSEKGLIWYCHVWSSLYLTSSDSTRYFVYTIILFFLAFDVSKIINSTQSWSETFRLHLIGFTSNNNLSSWLNLHEIAMHITLIGLQCILSVNYITWHFILVGISADAEHEQCMLDRYEFEDWLSYAFEYISSITSLTNHDPIVWIVANRRNAV